MKFAVVDYVDEDAMQKWLHYFGVSRVDCDCMGEMAVRLGHCGKVVNLMLDVLGGDYAGVSTA